MIRLDRVDFSYPPTPILRQISLTVNKGQFVGIIGPNGAGKSTLLKIMAGILPVDSGNVLLNERSLGDFSRQSAARVIGYVGQSFKTAFNFSVYEIVMMGRYPHLSPFAKETLSDRKMIRSAMEETDVWPFRERLFTELSGGERQRVILAAALAQEPQLLLLDEPTTALDIRHQVIFYNILKSLQSEKGLTIITVTHDINLAARYCDRLIMVKEGAIVADGSADRILKKPLLESVYETGVDVITNPRDGKPMLVPSV